MTSPVEYTQQYATTVDSVPEAFTFVMQHLDDLGPDPTIQITPFWSFDMIGGLEGREEAEEGVRRFGVVVSGSTSDS